MAGQHGHTVMVTYPYVYMTYIVSPLASLGGGISWQPGHQAALLTTELARQAPAAVGVGTCWPWETAATLPSARRRKALRRRRGRRVAGHIMAAARLQLVH